MKTFILTIEPHDDLTSARDKMGWGKSSRILIVWPEKEKTLNRKLDLVLLKRHAESLGTQIALVSRDRHIRYYAPRLGIPVYNNLAKARNAVWRLPRRFRRWQLPSSDTLRRVHSADEAPASNLERLALMRPDREMRRLHPVVRVGFFLAGVLSFLLLAANLLPGAEIQLVPRLKEQRLTFRVQASPGISEVQLSGQLPVRTYSAVVEGRESQPASKMVDFPDRLSSGLALFTNLTDQPVEVPAGTVIRTLENPPQRFQATSPGTVRPGAGQTLSLPVRCMEPGPAGNVPADSLVAIEGKLGTSLSVTNPQPTSGGSLRSLPVPDESDREQLEESLKRALQVTALDEMKQNLAPGDLVFPASIRLTQVLDREFQPATGQPGDQLQLVLQARYEANGVTRDDLLTLAEMALDADLPPGYTPVAGTLQVTSLYPSVLDGDSAHWSITASRQLQAVLPQAQVVQLALGLKPEAAAARLASQLDLETAPRIRLIPAWWPRLPYVPLRIRIHLVQPGA